MQTCDAAVIGGGIIGAACAYELASCGLRVAVVEPNATAEGGTGLGFGSLSIAQETPGQIELTRFGMDLWSGLADWLPADCEYERNGTVWVAADECEMGYAVRRWETFNGFGVEAELLDAKQVAEAEPALKSMAGGVFVPGDGSLSAPRAAHFLLQLASQKGAWLIRQNALSLQEHEVTLEDGATLYAGSIINSAGGSAAKLTPELPILFSKGHVLVVETEAPCAHHGIRSLGAGTDLGPNGTVRFEARPGGRHENWIGSSYQSAEDAIKLEVEPLIVAALLRLAIETLPAIGRARPSRSWTGLRTETADGLPLIGRMAGTESIFAATGHGGFGATAALATAKLIADEILCRTPEIAAARYWPGRFKTGAFKKESSRNAK